MTAFSPLPDAAYAAIARSLRGFGYPDVTPEMIVEVDEALHDGAANTADLPHGIVGMFAYGQLERIRTEIDDDGR